MGNNEFDNLPKSIKKATRYILQDASEDKLNQVKVVILGAIEQREIELRNEGKK
ncbi:hypothetical protein [Salirhabdus sp. Marseille-P4669]|uniref:hypothetical protein n=1 Tax=Salirhabdus sp. Marseille-P4669 TaxID=2042310 RepID=UPI00190EC2B7|nr:hypothetical protein [Salirhabdus sp. Marseille-P4669]